MKKEDMTKEITEQLQGLREHTANMNALMEALSQIPRGSDVALSTVEQVKKLVANTKSSELKASLDKIFRTLKLRAKARVNEI